MKCVDVFCPSDLVFSLLSAAAAAILPSGAALAATQGSLGATSTGTVTMTVSVPNRARITGLSDITFLNQDPNTAINAMQSVCVWSNTATKRYTVTATGSGAAQAFRLSNAGLTVPYSVQWVGGTASTASGVPLVTNTASAAFTSAATEQSCASGVTASANLIVSLTTADLGAMQAATDYTGTLTLVITPQ